MKKLFTGLAASALALGAMAMPASAGGPDSIWGIIEDNNVGGPLGPFADTELLEDIILIAGYADMLDACGNGKPQYTLFAPVDALDIPEYLGGPTGRDVLAGIGITGDDADALYDGDGAYVLPVLEAVLDLLGYSIADLNSASAVVRGILNDHLVNGSFSPWQLDQDEITTITARSGFTLRNENRETISDQPIVGYTQACNGFVYFILGFIDSTPQVPTEGLNALDSPKDGTPGGSNSLPDTL